MIKGLKLGQAAVFPEEFVGLLSPEQYIVRSYRAPELTTEEISSYLAYLCAPDHLSTFSQNWFNEHRVFGRTHGTYIKAAINSLLTFANPNYVPVMPERIIYRRKSKEEEEIEIAEKCVSACWVLGVPAFATFKLKEPISQDKLRLILIAGKSKAETFTRTALTLVLGSLFEYGADLAIKAGLVRSEDVDKVTIYPDKTHSPNCVIDGELVEFDKKLTLERGEQKATILIPKELYGL